MGSFPLPRPSGRQGDRFLFRTRRLHGVLRRFAERTGAGQPRPGLLYHVGCRRSDSASRPSPAAGLSSLRAAALLHAVSALPRVRHDIDGFAALPPQTLDPSRALRLCVSRPEQHPHDVPRGRVRSLRFDFVRGAPSCGRNSRARTGPGLEAQDACRSGLLSPGAHSFGVYGSDARRFRPAAACSHRSQLGRRQYSRIAWRGDRAIAAGGGIPRDDASASRELAPRARTDSRVRSPVPRRAAPEPRAFRRDGRLDPGRRCADHRLVGDRAGIRVRHGAPRALSGRSAQGAQSEL
ncbi:MAG: hypothetical protein BWZ10_02424 [candidate division BRC1 bacterium ADurb.BinA364]|nr:MAG: hypothetical protein BWZ10_02424 [candidate division BRC1 bacterium ADurb.BinA364]